MQKRTPPTENTHSSCRRSSEAALFSSSFPCVADRLDLVARPKTRLWPGMEVSSFIEAKIVFFLKVFFTEICYGEK